jgi:hypothetical protein
LEGFAEAAAKAMLLLLIMDARLREDPAAGVSGRTKGRDDRGDLEADVGHLHLHQGTTLVDFQLLQTLHNQNINSAKIMGCLKDKHGSDPRCLGYVDEYEEQPFVHVKKLILVK